jgi:hypothetical protein
MTSLLACHLFVRVLDTTKRDCLEGERGNSNLEAYLGAGRPVTSKCSALLIYFIG